MEKVRDFLQNGRRPAVSRRLPDKQEQQAIVVANRANLLQEYCEEELYRDTVQRFSTETRPNESLQRIVAENLESKNRMPGTAPQSLAGNQGSRVLR